MSLNKTVTQTQKTTQGPKESKGKRFLVNISTLKSDFNVHTLEARPEAGLVGHVLSSHSQVWPPFLRPAIASMLPGSFGCLGPGIRKKGEEGGKRECADSWQLQ
jgi:hypothetical protein